MAEHGTRSAYVAGCQCSACREANAAYQRRRMGYERRVPSAPAHRMLGELQAAGFSRRALADELGRDRRNVFRRRPTMQADCFRRICDLYDWMLEHHPRMKPR